MAEIHLTKLERLRLHAVIMNEVCRDDDDTQAINRFGKMIKLPKAYMNTLYRELPNGDRLNNAPAIEKLEEDDGTESFESEVLVFKKVLKQLTTWKDKNGLPPIDADWFYSVKDKLSAIS